MKILLINKFYYPCGGTEKYLRSLEVLLRSKGHEVIIFSMQDPRNWPCKQEKFFTARVDVQRFSISGVIKTFYNQDAALKLKALIAKEKPDIAHLHNISHHLSPAIIGVLREAGIPVVQTLHDYRLVCPNRILYTGGKPFGFASLGAARDRPFGFAQDGHCERCQGGRYYNCALHRCVQRSYAKSILAMLEVYWHHVHKRSYDGISRFIAPSRYMKEACVRFGVDSGKIAVINNFLSAEELHADEPASNAKTKPYFLYFARLEPEKGIDTLIKAWPQVKNKYSLKIAGRGPDYKRLSGLVKKLGLTDRVEFVGHKQGDELEVLVREAKAVFFPSRWAENMPYSLIEALARGKVVVASKSGGLPEFVRHGENGFLFKAGQADELAAIVNGLDEKNLDRISLKARESVLAYNEERHYRELMGVYKEGIRNKGTLIRFPDS